MINVWLCCKRCSPFFLQQMHATCQSNFTLARTVSWLPNSGDEIASAALLFLHARWTISQCFFGQTVMEFHVKNGTNLWEVKSWKPIQKILRISWQLAIPWKPSHENHHTFTTLMMWHEKMVNGIVFYIEHMWKNITKWSIKKQHWCDGWPPLTSLITWTIDIIGLAGDPSGSVPALSPLLAAGRSPVTSHQSPVGLVVCKPFLEMICQWVWQMRKKNCLMIVGYWQPGTSI